MKNILGIIVAFFLSGMALAQPVGQLPSGTVWGNSTAARAPASAATITGLIDRAISGTQGAVMTRDGSAWIGLAPGTAGLPLLSGGAAANLAYGIPALAAGGTGANLTASTGGIFYSGASAAAILAGTSTARQMVQSGAGAAPSWSTTTWPATSTINQILFSSSANVIGEIATVNGGIINANSSGVPASTITPVLGVPGSSTGTMGFAGITSGTAIITPQSAAGTPTLTLPNTSGTFAVGATSPLVLSATTGDLTCPTCVTGTGGAITAGTTTTSGFSSGQAFYSNGTTVQAAGVTGTLGSFVLSAGPTLTGSPVINSSSAAALSVGANGGTNPALLIDASTVSSATGISVKSAAAAGGAALAVISSGTNENLTIDAKGSGTISIGSISTGAITLGRATTVNGAINKVTITAPATGSTLTIADGKTLTDTSGVGANLLLGATGGGFSTYAGTSCTNQFVRSLGSSGAAACATVANTDLTNSAITIAGTSTSLGGSITASAILDSIGSTQGQVLYRGASGWTILAPGTSGYVLTTGGAGANPSWVNPTTGGTVTSITCGSTLSCTSSNPITTSGTINLSTARQTLPTTTTYTTGSGTYTTPANVLWVRVRLIGGGGGGAGSGTSPGSATAGGNTTFGTATASGGGAASSTVGGTGGAASGGTWNFAGSDGGPAAGAINASTEYFGGGDGGASCVGGAGHGGNPGAADGTAGKTNTGSGGGGASGNLINAAGGGAAGGCVDWVIASPSATYSYGIGAAGSGGTAGSGGSAGGAGAAGIIMIEEHYN